jgi:hypothetical protein
MPLLFPEPWPGLFTALKLNKRVHQKHRQERNMFMKIGEAAARHSIKRNAINYLVRTGTIETRQDAQGVTLVNVEHLLTHLASKAKTTTSVVHELAQTVQNEHVNMPPTPAAVAPAQTQTADPRLEAVLAAVGELTARVNAVQDALDGLARPAPPAHEASWLTRLLQRLRISRP